MEQQVLVSVLIPNYNEGAAYGRETLESIIAQTYQIGKPLLLTTDPTDKSDDVGANYAAKDSGIKYFKRAGCPMAHQPAETLLFQKSKGRNIIFLDSDDLLAPHCLEQRVVTASTNTGYDFGCFLCCFLKQNNKKPEIFGIRVTSDQL